jgi:molybdopterin converting factor subunit 1
MRVTVRLFARLRDVAGAGDFEREAPPAATIRTIWESLAREHPGLEPYGASISSARNAEYAQMDTPVADGDEIAFLPPVSGG